MLYNIIKVHEGTNEETVISAYPMSLTEANHRMSTELRETKAVYYKLRGVESAELGLTKAKLEAQHAMQRVIQAVITSQPVDPEDIVVIRRSSEQFAELAEAYIEVHTEAKSFDEAYGV